LLIFTLLKRKSKIMQSKIKPQDHEFFELMEKGGGTFHFATYYTPAGELRGIKIGEDKNGQTIYKRFSLDKENKMRIHKANKVELEFITNHPNNPDSPYFNGIARFRKYAPEKQDRQAIDIEVAKAAAVTEAGNLKGTRLFEIAALLGMFYDETPEGEISALRAVIGVAVSDPSHFLKVFNTPRKESKVRRVIKAAIHEGVITRDNGVYRFGSVTLGIDEDGVVGKLTAEEDLFTLVERRVGLAEEKEVAAKVEAPKSELPPKQKAVAGK
jgi:hypothetical protein